MKRGATEPRSDEGDNRGEFCALELDDGSMGLSYVLLDDTLARLRGADAAPGLAGADALELARQFVGADSARRTIGCLPDALFARGVSLIGGSWVLDGPAYVDALRRSAMRSTATRKMAISAQHYPGFEALLVRL